MSRTRNTEAAQAFFEKSIGSRRRLEKVNMDKSGAGLAGFKEINNTLPEKKRIKIQQVKYIKNMIEQEYRGIKRITNPMLGFKCFI